MTATKLAESVDYFNPFVAARIITPDGTNYPLWAGQKAQTVGFDIKAKMEEGRPDSLRSLSFLTDVSVEMNLGFIPRITATLRPPFEDFVKLINTDLLDYGMNRLQVQLGYVTGSNGSPILQSFEGTMLQPPQLTISGDCSITITAQGVGGAYAGAMLQGATTFENMTRIEIMTKLGDEYGWTFVIDDDTRKDVGPDLIAEKITKTQGWQTPLFFITQLAMEARSILIFGGRDDQGKQIVNIISRTVAFARQQPQFIFSMFHFGKDALLGKNVLPILSMQVAPQIFIHGIQQLVLRDVDGTTKALNVNAITAKDNQTAQTTPGPIDAVGGVAQSLPKATDTSSTFHAPGDPADPSAVARARRDFDKATQGAGLPIDLETIGMPLIQPGNVIQINSLGPKIDGIYAVFTVTHQYSSGGFTTQIHAISNTARMLDQAIRSTEQGNQNKSETKEDGGSTDKKEASGN